MRLTIYRKGFGRFDVYSSDARSKKLLTEKTISSQNEESDKVTNEHERVRNDHASEIAEDYVEAILDVIEEKKVCRAVDLTRKFQVTHVTVNKTIKRLARDGFVIAEPYSPIELTELGIKTARESRERHEIVFRFLLTLGVSESTAATDSEGIEHHVSDETLAAMQKAIGRANPKKQ